MKNKLLMILFIIIMIFDISYGNVMEYNNNRIYFNEKNPVDISKVEIVNDYYIKDKDKYYSLVYYSTLSAPSLAERLYMFEKKVMTTVAIEEKPVKIKDEYFFSENKVYYRGREMKGVDPKTIKILSNGVSKDGNNVYFEERLFEKTEKFYNIGKNYFRDNENIYVVYYSDLLQLQALYPYNIEKVEGIDISTVKVIGENYLKDKNGIYFIGTEISESDKESFRVINNMFSKDKNNVYFEEKKIEGADVKTFKPLEYRYSRDKNKLYIADRFIQNIDAKNVEIFNRYVYKINGKYYLRPFYSKNKYDKNGLIQEEGIEEINGSLKLRKIDYLFFMIGDKLYYRDVFGVHIMNIENPEKFKKLKYDYYTDGKNIYYFSHQLAGLDKESMKIINEYTIQDKNYIFYGQNKEKNK